MNNSSKIVIFASVIAVLGLFFFPDLFLPPDKEEEIVSDAEKPKRAIRRQRRVLQKDGTMSVASNDTQSTAVTNLVKTSSQER